MNFRSRALVGACGASLAMVGLTPHASSATGETTVTEVSAVGEVHYCQGYLTVTSGSFRVTKTVTPLTQAGTYSVVGSIQVIGEITLTDSQGAIYKLTDQGAGSSFTLVSSDGWPTGTFQTNQRYTSLNGKFKNAISKNTTTLNADGSQSTSYGGGCGQEPIN